MTLLSLEAVKLVYQGEFRNIGAKYLWLDTTYPEELENNEKQRITVPFYAAQVTNAIGDRGYIRINVRNFDDDAYICIGRIGFYAHATDGHRHHTSG